MMHSPSEQSISSIRRSGWTLVELLVVLLILGLLVGITLPAVHRIRDVAARAGCASNLRQLALGVHLYADAWHQLPEGCAYPRPLFPRPGISWHTNILPYVEQNQLWQLAWEAFRQDRSGDHSSLHAAVMAKSIPVFLCPSDSRETGVSTTGRVWGLTSYRGVAGTGWSRNDGVFHRNYTVRFADITDGSSNTLMIGERPPGPEGRYGGWYAGWGDAVCFLAAQILPAGRNDWIPERASDCDLFGSAFRQGQLSNLCDVNHFWSVHIGGANFAFADASVRFLRYAQSDVMPALATRAGGEIVNTD
jgi:prepilin-type N-terminal cleavage/methylation domain-containing protein/prepilin-type processing-associated H-X9-DG protein